MFLFLIDRYEIYIKRKQTSDAFQLETRLETRVWSEEKTTFIIAPNTFTPAFLRDFWPTQGMCKDQVRKEWIEIKDVFDDKENLIPFSKFYVTLQDQPWRRMWIIAVLKHIHADQNIAPPPDPVYSEASLAHLRNIPHKIRKGLQNMSFFHVYETWRILLMENGIVHPVWKMEDCEFTSAMTNPSMVTCRIFDEMLSFNRQGCIFTYELLGMTHIDMDDVFDWMRVELRGRDWLGIDIPDGGARCDGKGPHDIKQENALDPFSFDAGRRHETE